MRYVVALLLLAVSSVCFGGEVWNKVNPPDVTREVIETAGPGGHILLKLKGVHSAENIDNVQVFFEVGAALKDGSVRWVRSHVASIVLESVPQNGANIEFDVTNYFTFILSHDPKELRNFRVMFVQVPKNSGVKQNDESFSVDWTYFEIVDAKGNPIPQPKREPKYGSLSPQGDKYAAIEVCADSCKVCYDGAGCNNACVQKNCAP